jgi:hypothetical protein
VGVGEGLLRRQVCQEASWHKGSGADTLHRTKEPTGDPHIPSPVLRAQQVKQAIDEKMDATRGSPDSKQNLLSAAVMMMTTMTRKWRI